MERRIAPFKARVVALEKKHERTKALARQTFCVRQQQGVDMAALRQEMIRIALFFGGYHELHKQS